MLPHDEERVHGAANPVRSINRVFTLLRRTAAPASNDNAGPRAKVLEFKRPPPAPSSHHVFVSAEIPEDVRGALCREVGFVTSVTDPKELDAARWRWQKRMNDIATEALIRYVRARNEDGQG